MKGAGLVAARNIFRQRQAAPPHDGGRRIARRVSRAIGRPDLLMQFAFAG